MRKKMKAKNPQTFNEHLDKKYGEEGTTERAAFYNKAMLYMITELKGIPDNDKPEGK